MKAPRSVMPLAYRADDAFDLLGISRTRGYEIIRQGELQTYIDGRRRMVTRRALEAYISAREQQALSPPRRLSAIDHEER